MARKRRPARADVVRRAMQKQQTGAPLTNQEADELDRFREQKEFEIVKRWLEEIPKTFFCDELAGRKQKQVDDQAMRYNLAMGGPSINMREFVGSVFTHLARNKHILAAADDNDPLMAGVTSVWLERYRKERTHTVRMERMVKEGRLIDRELIHEMFSRMAEINRRTGKMLEKTFGREALDIFNDGFKKADREAKKVVGKTAGAN